jgi:thioredoxin reductase/NAD-dependent dihydropyrimidine dehydrogenase PreA subunit
MFAWMLRRRVHLEHVSKHTFLESVDAGLTQPPSLHPVIDTVKCIGCESCVHACPEFPAHQVLGIMHSKATLVSPTDCIGHGACEKVCPTGAISLVFGTAERGVDIPDVNPDFSTNVPGIYIAGELGGMGLIRNAIEQGRQAMETIAGSIDTKARGKPKMFDVIIVGAGPAGIAATLGAMEQGLACLTIEQNALGGTVANFPRGKIVMTAPARLPKVGIVNFKETTKEKLIDFWTGVQKEHGMKIRYKERMKEIERRKKGVFKVVTNKRSYLTRSILLAIGRRGTPRKLGVEGEEMAKVTYTLIDPREYQARSVLVVGGGDSAIEAACSIAREPGTKVTLSYRSDAFSRAKKKNRTQIENMAAKGDVQVILESNVVKISAQEVELEHNGKHFSIPNDSIIVCAGGILPDGMLNDIGIKVETKHGTA